MKIPDICFFPETPCSPGLPQTFQVVDECSAAVPACRGHRALASDRPMRRASTTPAQPRGVHTVHRVPATPDVRSLSRFCLQRRVCVFLPFACLLCQVVVSFWFSAAHVHFSLCVAPHSLIYTPSRAKSFQLRTHFFSLCVAPHSAFTPLPSQEYVHANNGGIYKVVTDASFKSNFRDERLL